jgi:peptidoglycan/xylan/chitin deacetylase (PgdA/CDA1 family)
VPGEPSGEGERVPVGLVKRSLKAASEATLGRGRALRLALALGRSPGAVLAYHNIIPDDAAGVGDAPLHLPLSDFRAQLDRLQTTHTVVPLGDLRRALTDASFDRPVAAITFDDAYRGAITLGLKELASRGLPSTVFVAPGLMRRPWCWWDAFAHVLRDGAHPRTRFLDDLAGDADEISAWSERRGHTPSALPDVACPASREEAAEAASRPGVTFGSHSWTHRNLVRLDGDARRGELAGSLHWLRGQGWPSLPWVAYPYGVFDSVVEEDARAAGYEGALSVGTGCLRTGRMQRFTLPRVSVPAGISPEGLMLRVAGVVAE